MAADEEISLSLKVTGMSDFLGDMRSAKKASEDLASGFNGLKFDNFVRGFSDSGKAASDFGGHTHDLIGKLGDLGEKAGKVVIDGFDKMGRATLGAVEKFGSLALAAGKAATAIATDFVKDSVKAYNEFEAKIQEVAGVSENFTDQNKEDLKKLAIQMGKDLPISATDAADSFVELAKAGFTTDEILHKFGNSLAYLSTAGGLNMARSSEILGAALRAYGLNADQAAHSTDVLAKTANVSAVGINDIGETLKYVGPVAHSAGISLEETSAAIAVLGNVGIKGSMAGTTLRSTISRLVAPPKQAAEALAALGFTMEKQDGTLKTLDEALRELRPKFANLTAAQRESMAAAIAGKPAMAGFLQLIETSQGDYDNMTAAIKKSDGAAKQMSDTMMDSGKGSFEQLGGSIETLRIAFVDKFAKTMQDNVLGNITKLVNAMIPAAEFLGENFAKAVGVAGQALGAFATAIAKGGDADTSKFNLLQNIFFTLGQVTKFAFGQAGDSLKTFIAALTGDWTDAPGINAFQKVAGNLGLFFRNDLLPAAQGFFNWLVQNGPPILSTVGQFVGNVLLPAFRAIGGWIVSTGVPIFNSLVKVFREDIMPAAQKMVKEALPPLLDAFTKIGDFIKDPLLPTVGKMVAIFLGDVVPTVMRVADIIVTNLKPALEVAVKWVRDELAPKFQDFLGWFKKDGIPVIEKVASVVGGVLSVAFQGLGPIVSTSFTIATESTKVLFGVVNGLVTFLQHAPDTIGTAFQIMGNIIGGAFNGAKWVVGKAVNFLIDALNTVSHGINILIDGNNAINPIFKIGRIPDIPYVPFAQGGLVTGPTRGLLGEAGSEAVLPLAKMVPLFADAMISASRQVSQSASAQQIYNSAYTNSRSSSSYSNVNNYNYSPNIQAPPSVPATFGLMKAMA